MASIAPRSGRGRRTMNEINMVPFIDVMLVLLIIFMVTAPLISPSVIDLPTVGKAATVPDQVIHVEISKDEKITLKSTGTTVATQSSSLDMLARDVRQLQGEVAQGPVVITADRTIKYETVVKAMDVLQRAGVQRVGLAVQLVD
ncbi:protein TolR [Limnohabitans sp. JirII-29]|jgi:biopolymer transport protein TolR|uniref:ExbD/TolR family protein n=1 Tax=Limnohabitans sp. JirII-29 TaxID=1835756 RepID=UPI000D388645|nr:ExbD/TolR family protein [Limnohabitans sp. JirII-29]PUE26276.1 protein TolR [Limnohabitans sp. JirII-29]